MDFVEQTVAFDGFRIHTWEAGSGFPVLLLHGTGPGTSTIGNFAQIMEPLAGKYRILASDLVGFGLSGRKTTEPYFDFDLWCRQAQFLLDRMEGDSVGVFGHSLSGAVALRLAADNPRVTKVLTTGSIGSKLRVNEHLARIWTFPEDLDQLRSAIETLVHDGSVITDRFLDQRLGILHGDGYAPYFRSMFGGDKQRLMDGTIVPEADLARIAADVLMMHGRDDRPVPAAETSLVLGRLLRNCDVMLVGRCGHSPSLEHPGKVLGGAELLFG